MPLQSRANRITTPVARPTPQPQAGVDLNTSPRKRAPQPVASEAEPPAREEAVAEQTEEAASVEHEQLAAQPQETPAAQAAAGVAKRVTRKRATKPKPELPDDLNQLLESDDPAELRASLKLVEDTVRDRRKAFEDELKMFRTLYRELSDKLAGTL